MGMNCEHEKWVAKEVLMADGRPSLREFCVSCGEVNAKTLPMVSDTEVFIKSYKYQGKTLGEVFVLDKEYVKWIVRESKATDRIKKSAARIYFGEGYVTPKDGEVYLKEKCYDFNRGVELMNKLCQ